MFWKYTAGLSGTKTVTEEQQMEVTEIVQQPGGGQLPQLPQLPSDAASTDIIEIEQQLMQTEQTTLVFPSTSSASVSVPVVESNLPLVDVNVKQAIQSIFKHNGRFVCPFVHCKKDYAHKSDCNKHVKGHCGKDEFQCETCGMKLGCAKSLLEHTHGVHIKGDFLYNCKCGKGYYYGSHFNVHKQMCKHEDSTDKSDAQTEQK